MTILQPSVVEELQRVFQGLQHDVELDLVDEGGQSDLDQLLRELEETHEKIHYRRLTRDQAGEASLDGNQLPAIVFKMTDGYKRARFLGAPSGHEFAVLVHDVVDVAEDNIELSEDTKAFLDGLQNDVHLQVFTTPT